MILKQEIVEISKREYDFIKDDLGRLVLYGCYIEKEKGYPPEGYGSYNEQIYEENNKYYFSWERMRSCE